MNVSGGPVAGLAKFYGVEPEHVVVVHDELDIPFDTIKLKTGGGHGGHNGVRDVAKALDSAEFARVRVGIGRPPGRQDPADWVLDPFGATSARTCRSCWATPPTQSSSSSTRASSRRSRSTTRRALSARGGGDQPPMPEPAGFRRRGSSTGRRRRRSARRGDHDGRDAAPRPRRFTVATMP